MCWMLVKRLFLISALLVVSAAANATFHLWTISEVYSNADGTVQFVEFRTSAPGQQFLAGHVLTAYQGGTIRQFTFPANLPADSTNRSFLVGTQGFAALGIVAPDYVVANNFLFLPGGGVDFAGSTGTIVPVTPPGPPGIGPAAAGDGQATISFTPPGSTGGSPITGYTATCNPGSVSASGAAAPIIVSGLTNGTSYACSVTATNAKGTGPASATVSVTPAARVTSFAGSSPTGTGTITAAFTGGGPSCTFTASRLVALTGDAASPPAGSAPSNTLFPHGLFAFSTGGCNPGSTIAVTVTYPSALPPGTQYWKYGPTAAQPAAHWYTLPATIAGNTASFSIADGGLGDDDLAVNGTIVDQGGPGAPPAGAAAAIPALGEWALILLAGMLAMAGLGAIRRNPAR